VRLRRFTPANDDDFRWIWPFLLRPSHYADCRCSKTQIHQTPLSLSGRSSYTGRLASRTSRELASVRAGIFSRP